jgi:hypothetical protein
MIQIGYEFVLFDEHNRAFESYLASMAQDPVLAAHALPGRRALASIHLSTMSRSAKLCRHSFPQRRSSA